MYFIIPNFYYIIICFLFSIFVFLFFLHIHVILIAITLWHTYIRHNFAINHYRPEIILTIYDDSSYLILIFFVFTIRSSNALEVNICTRKYIYIHTYANLYWLFSIIFLYFFLSPPEIPFLFDLLTPAFVNLTILLFY